MPDSFDKKDREKLLNQKVIFCTECDIELVNFCFTDGADNAEAIRKNLAQCKKSGKFAGEFCSKLFIAGDKHLESLFDRDEL